MKFSDIKNDIIIPKNQIVIDKKLLVDGKEFHILSIYEDSEGVKIVTLNIGGFENSDLQNVASGLYDVKTRRDELIFMAKHNEDTYRNVDSYYLDDVKLKGKSASGGGLYEQHYDFFKLSYIANLGIDLNYLDDVQLENIVVWTQELDVENLEALDFEKAKTLKITRSDNYKNVLLNVDYKFTLNKDDYSFTDENNVEHNFSARLKEVDLWGEVPKLKARYKELYEKLDEIEKEQCVMPDFETIYDDVCPKGMNLLCVAYESDIQLNFYTKEYLDTEVERNNSQSMMFLRDDETSERFSILKPVAKGSIESVVVELFSCVKINKYDDIVIDL